MGGFVIYVSRDCVHEIYIGVEERIQAIITSGVAITESDRAVVGERIRKQLDDT